MPPVLINRDRRTASNTHGDDPGGAIAPGGRDRHPAFRDTGEQRPSLNGCNPLQVR